jgi:hypothetical protein
VKAGTPAAVAERDAPQCSQALVAALRSPACYSHPVGEVTVMQTHISYVVLAGEFAYKIKKPVRFPFLDFASLEARRFYCEEELRLNRRAAPSLYLEVVRIGGTPEHPVVGGAGPAIEFAVRMRRFRQSDLLDARAREGRLLPADVDALAAAVARFHADAMRAPRGTAFGAPGLLLEQALDNFTAIEGLEREPGMRRLLDELREWTLREHAARIVDFENRRSEGFVRECHGDLHLGNVVMLDGGPAPFDCIEFDPRLRMIDVMSDVAFTVMDLHHLELPRLAARYLDAYLQKTGDYAGLGVLRFHCVYRAMVRAKVACLRAHQADLDERERPAAFDSLRSHLALARRLARRGTPGLVLMHGLSGSGKTTIAAGLLESLGAIRLRSDVERKRLHGLPLLGVSGSPTGGGIYSEDENQGTYERLAALAHRAMAASYPVIVDATFLRREQRAVFRALAERARVPFTIVSCEAPEPVLRERLAIRARGQDASEADAAVLALQIERSQPLGPDELADAIVLDTTHPEPAREAHLALLDVFSAANRRRHVQAYSPSH